MALLGIDVGTSGTRALAIDAAGKVVASASAEYPLSTPRPGWTEQDPEDWWKATSEVLSEVTSKLSEPPKAIGVSGQMHGSVFLDEHDQVIRPALLWNDQRTSSQCAEITAAVGARRLIDITGNPAITGFQAPKILWLRDEEPQNHARIRHVLLPKDYVRLRLTGERATDASDASGTLLLDLAARDWSQEILSKLDIPRDWLPAVGEGPELSGRISKAAAAETGLPAGLLVAAGAGDNAAAAVGNGVVRDGLISCSIGTSGVVFAHTDRPKIEPRGRLHAFCHAVPRAYHLMGVTLSAGGSLSWWRDALGDELDYGALSDLASQAPAGSEGLVFLPYLSGERTPWLDPEARGMFAGLTLRHTRAHMTRAVMEGVTFSLKDCLDLMTAVGLEVGEVRATGGGARSDLWRSIAADVLGTPIHRTATEEGPAYGAALLAGITAGVYRDIGEATAHINVLPEVAHPDRERHSRYADLHEVYSELYPATKEAMHRLAGLGRQ